jgi:hypothetical protein
MGVRVEVGAAEGVEAMAVVVEAEAAGDQEMVQVILPEALAQQLIHPRRLPKIITGFCRITDLISVFLTEIPGTYRTKPWKVNGSFRCTTCMPGQIHILLTAPSIRVPKSPSL